MTTKAAKIHPRISVTLSPDQSSGDFPVSEQANASTPAEDRAAFPISAIVREEHPRESAWAGLAEAAQILCEAEAHKGALLSQKDLHAIMFSYLDAYEPRWFFHLRGISDAWMSGWEHAFALAAQRTERLACPEPLSGFGLFGDLDQEPVGEATAKEQRPTVRFRKACLLVTSAEDFFQGLWEGQWTAINMQDTDPRLLALRGRTPSPPLSSAWCFDELLDLFYETGNHPLDFVVGYVLGLCEGLLCGRTNAPARVQGEHASTSAGVIGNS